MLPLRCDAHAVGLSLVPLAIDTLLDIMTLEEIAVDSLLGIVAAMLHLSQRDGERDEQSK